MPPSTTSGAAEWLAEIPHRFSIDEGPELREAMAELVDRLSASLQPLPHRSANEETEHEEPDDA